MSGDAITAGVVTSAAADVATYRDSVTPMANVTTPFATTKGISNYNVIYDLKQVISCKAVTLKAKDSTKVYDGVVSTQPGFTATALEATDSHIFTVQMADTCNITNVGTKANVIAKVDGVDVTPGTTTTVGNYCVDVENGTLTITKAPLTITAGSDTKVYDGTALIKNSYTNTALASTDHIESVTITGSQTVVGTSNNVPSAAVIKNTASEDVTANYDITYANGTLTVTKKTLTITADDATKVYNGTALTKDSYTHTALASGDNITSVTITGSQTVVGTSNNVPSAAVIKNAASEDVTSSYNITYVNGTLEVTCKKVTITAKSATKIYDGTALTEPGFTASALEAGDSHIFIVAMTSASTITKKGTQPNVIETVDGVSVTTGVETPVGNYCVTVYNGTLEVTKKFVTVTAASDIKIYDGTPLTNSNATAATLAVGDVLHSCTVTGSQTESGSSANVPTNAVIWNAANEDVTESYNISYVNGVLEVTKASMILSIDTTKVYDGTPFLVTFDQLHVTGLHAGDHFVSGQIVTESADVNTYRCSDGAFMGVLADGFAVQSGFQILSASNVDVTASYTPKFSAVLKIASLAITIKANDSTKVYDGTALTNNKYSITVGSLASTDELTSCTVTGEQICMGYSNNVPSAAVIMQGTNNVTSNYTITYANGTLTVNPFTDFHCPLDEKDTLNFGECELYYTLKGTATVGTGMAAGSYSITNDLVNPLTAGVHVITWTLKDRCDQVMSTCTQNVTISYRPCPDAVDYEGEVYESVRIGCDCWTKRNLKSQKYSDGADIPCVYNYQSETYPNVTDNVNTYGRLYCFEAAVRDSADNGYGHIQGICPAGWYLPTPEKYTALNAYGADALKSPLYWIPSGGSNTTGFSALPAGCYNGITHRYEGLRGNTYFWSTLNTGSLTGISVFSMYLDCEIVTEIDNYLGMGYSVRCIKEKE